MKKFDYDTLNNLVLTPEMVNKMNQIYELRGQMANLRLKNPAVLTRMTKVAKIESTDASNRIEGIYTSQTRLKKLVSQTTTPQNRSEAEISGYRDVLNLIHTNFREINLTTSNILTLHKHLFRLTEDSWGGHFKDINNQVLETTENGETTVRFNPPAAHLTPNLVDELCQQFSEAVDRSKLPVLLLCAAFTFDFVTIHPFRDGNGRMSRLLMLLTLSRAGFTVGQFISLEKLIEEQKDAYYAILQESTVGWSENSNNYGPFINFFLSVVLQTYRDFHDRLTPLPTDFEKITPKRDSRSTTKPKRLTPQLLVMNALQEALIPINKQQIMNAVPQYSQKTIERTLRQLVDAHSVKMSGRSRGTKYQLA